MPALAIAIYFALGLLQFTAIVEGLGVWLGFHWGFSTAAAYIIAWVPVIGTIIGMAGAVTAWDWSWFQAGSVFVGTSIGIAVLAILSGGTAAVHR